MTRYVMLRVSTEFEDVLNGLTTKINKNASIKISRVDVTRILSKAIRNSNAFRYQSDIKRLSILKQDKRRRKRIKNDYFDDLDLGFKI